MLKVCFAEMMYAMGPVVIQRLHQEIHQLIERDDHVEFWFSGCYGAFERAALAEILQSKEKAAPKKVEIVAILDPVKMERLSVESFDEAKDGFPLGSVTRTEFAPRIVGRSEQYDNRFVAHSMKIDRWIMEQCDVLLAFHYVNLPNPTNTEIRRAAKRTEIEIISIFDPDVAAYLDRAISEMNGRDGEILRGLQAGRTYNSLGKEFGVTLHRIKQIASRVERNLFRDVKRSFYEKS